MENGANMNNQDERHSENEKIQKKIYLSKQSQYYLKQMQIHMNQSISHIIEELIVDAFNKNNNQEKEHKK